MRAGAFIRQLRAYGELALRQRKEYREAVESITVTRWATILSEVHDPVELEELRATTASDVVRNYSEFDPQFLPDRETVIDWMDIPVDEVRPSV
jgi:hypothetical protein